MPTVNLPPVLRQVYNDSNGKPLAGGLLYSYQAGTTTPQNTYTDSTGLTLNANPIVLDANGGASMWLDPSLSYKFVLKDSLGNLQWTQDGVVGLLTVNAVNTSAIQDLAVTTAKIADGSITGIKLASDSSIDSNRPVGTNNIKNGAITHAKIDATAGFLAPSFQKFTSGSGTYNKTYKFFVSSANATSGATYTHNGVTYTVSDTISSGAILSATGSGDPLSSGTLTKATGTGDATIAFTAFSSPIYIKLRMVGGGGGGGGSGTSGQTAGGAGGDTTFGSLFLTASGGSGGPGASVGAGGAGGAVSVATGAIDCGSFAGGRGGPTNYEGSTTLTLCGGMGACSPFGGAGGSGDNSAGSSAVANTGSGGGGGGSNGGTTTIISGAGGGSGGFIHVAIISPSAAYAYSIGVAGTAGGAGSSGFAGGSGGSGHIAIEEYFQ